MNWLSCILKHLRAVKVRVEKVKSRGDDRHIEPLHRGRTDVAMLSRVPRDYEA